MSKKKNKKKYLTKYIIITLIVVVLTTLISFAVLYAMSLFTYTQPTVPNNPIDGVTYEEEREGFFQVPLKTNILVVGTDRSSRLADVIFVGSFDSSNSTVDIVNIPRDTFTSFNSEERIRLQGVGKNPPDKVKMTEAYSYGYDIGIDFFERHIESFMGINIDYYVVIDLDGFTSLVDAIGGVWFDVPQRMYKVDDKQVPPMVIDLQPGYQLLMGDEAEQLVRYRDYGLGDVGRISMQQEFMKATFEQMLTKSGLMNDPVKLISTYFKYVDTNFTVADLTKYVQFIPNLKPSSFRSHTMPVDWATASNGGIYPIQSEWEQLIDEVFYQSIEYDTPLVISVINGSAVSDLGDKLSGKLVENGYEVASNTVDNGNTEKNTIIQCNSNTNVDEIKTYFDNVEMKYDATMDEGEVTIILGQDETMEVKEN